MDCNSAPSGQLLKALGEFNRSEWFECHETLEDLWSGETGELKPFYQGILQIAVALHHWRNGNFGGAISLLQSGTGYLAQTPSICQRIDVDGIIEAGKRMRVALVELGPDRMAELPPDFIPRLRLVPLKEAST